MATRPDGMDIALAIWMLDPAAEYVLNEDGTTIADEYDLRTGEGAVNAWRGPGPRPTEDELKTAWEAYQASAWPAAHSGANLAPGQDPLPDRWEGLRNVAHP